MSEAEKKIDEIMKKLDEFEGRKKIIPLSFDDKIEDIMHMNMSEVMKTDSEIISGYAYELSRYSYYLQCLCNYEQSNVRLTESALNYIIGKNYVAYKGKFSTAEEVKGKIIADNDAAREYNRLLVLAKSRLDRISYLSSRVTHISQALTDVVRSRRQNDK